MSNRRAAKSGEGTRLEARDWVRAGLTQLADQGISGVKVEALAKRMGITKGSFYWHFKDREALLVAMLADWRRRATVDIINRLNHSEGVPAERLRKLLRLPVTGKSASWGADVELAIRLWGRHDPNARATLAEVDEIRIKHLCRLLEEVGIAPDQALPRAILAYSYMRVASTLIDADDTDLMARCEAVLFG